jgi:hypothetical protein
MPVTISEITLIQGATVSLGGTSISKPISLTPISLPNAFIEIPDFSSNSTVGVPGKQGLGDATLEANYFEAEFATMLGFKTGRTQRSLVVTLPASVGSGSSSGVFTCDVYVLDVTTPAIQDGQTTPASYSIVMKVLSIAHS